MSDPILHRIDALEDIVWRGDGDSLTVRMAQLEKDRDYMKEAIQELNAKMNILIGASVTGALGIVGDLLIQWFSRGTH